MKKGGRSLLKINLFLILNYGAVSVFGYMAEPPRFWYMYHWVPEKPDTWPSWNNMLPKSEWFGPSDGLTFLSAEIAESARPYWSEEPSIIMLANA